jgi:uncharacterized protein YcaQ
VATEPPAREHLSLKEAQTIALRAQGLINGPERPRTATAMLDQLGAVQLDTISVLARSHELVAYARLGAVPRKRIEDAYWSTPARAFEFWGHANCIFPMEAWPYFAFRRRVRLTTAAGWLTPESETALDEVRARLRDGPATVSDLGGGRTGDGGWWNWSSAKRAVEWLYYRGEVVCTNRTGWKRIYDLPERAFPRALVAHDPPDEECFAYFVGKATRALGVATRREIAAYFRLASPARMVPSNPWALVDSAIEACGLVAVSIEGWHEIAYAHPDDLAKPRSGRCRTTLLSPFDSLIWAPWRMLKRNERLFGFTYLMETYLPKEQRTHGYFVMPLLANGRIAGLADPVRKGNTLVLRRVSLKDRTAAPAMAKALREAATWVGCDSVVVESTDPPGALDGLGL